LDILKIFERKLATLPRPDNAIQYVATLPKKFRSTREKRATSFWTVFNDAPQLLPSNSVIEEDIQTFMKAHQEPKKIPANEAGVRKMGEAKEVP